jgi:hypothetical protein
MAMATSQRQSFWLGGADISIFVRFGVSNIIYYWCDSLVAKTPGKKVPPNRVIGHRFLYYYVI